MRQTVWLLEAYFSGSHRSWAEGYQKHSNHDVEIFSLPGRHWKWRMEGAAIHFAELLNNSAELPDRILVTDMLDLATFKGLLKEELRKVPVRLYFHENQFAYPLSGQEDREEFQYAWKNFTSALAADTLIFNSAYNRDTFFCGLTALLDRLPDHSPKKLVNRLRLSASIIPVGLELPKFEARSEVIEGPPVILWNHRWEHDKGPDEFFELLFELKQEGFPFKLIVLGERYKKTPAIFDKAREILTEEIVHWGFAPDRPTYWSTLRKADILPITSKHDFFGISVAEAIHAGVQPLLPKAMAYPELIAPDIHPSSFYTDMEDLKAKIKRIPKNSLPRMEQFSWTAIAPRLDALLGAR
jgi:glycosyltransferase involved in cell wall biosynthesis